MRITTDGHKASRGLSATAELLVLPTPRRRLCGLCVTRSCLSVCCEQDYCKSNHPIWLKLCVAIWPVNRKNWLTDITGNLLAFLMLVSSTRTQLGRRSFHVAAPTVWNVLPSQLRSSSISRGQFRAGLKTISSHRPTQTPLRTCVAQCIILRLHLQEHNFVVGRSFLDSVLCIAGVNESRFCSSTRPWKTFCGANNLTDLLPLSTGALTYLLASLQ